MKAHAKLNFKKLIVPGAVMLAFWGIAIWGFLASGLAQPLIMFGYIDTSLGVGLGLHGTLTKKKKSVGRRLTLFLIGMCPMDVRIPEYILDGKRVLSTECSLCQTCITVCAKDALKLSFGFDLGGKDLLREREKKMVPERVIAPASG